MHKVQMTYRGALEIAGYTVHEFEQFGSYQGEWWAKVTTPENEKGWIKGWYGSCSGCDAILAQFDYDFGKEVEDDWESRMLTDEQLETFRDFGKGEALYFYSQEKAIEEASSDNEWDTEVKEIIAFLTKHAWEA